jgi:AmiR/NasT family two-component response regulator
MPIDPAAMARHLSSLATVDAEQDLAQTMQQLTSAAKALLDVDGAGLMLADERGKGILMGREGIDDAAAFERLRSVSRSSRRPLIDVVDEVLGGRPLSRPRG